MICTTDCVHTEAARATEALLKDYWGIRLQKAIDLSTPRGFDLAVAGLAEKLRRTTASSDAQAVRDAAAELDIDWHSTSPRERANAIRQALLRAGRALQPGARAIEHELGPAARTVVAAARQEARSRRGLSIAVDFNAVDQRMIDYLRTSETHIVRDAYGRRLEQFSRAARTVVADGLERGLGRGDIATALKQAAEGTLTGRSGSYWEIVASAFTGRGRSYGLLSAFAEAGLQRYRIEAVLDEHTTPTCRFLHGKEFTVRAGLDAFAQAEAAPEQLKEISPWVRESRDGDTGRRVLYVTRGDERLPLAEELRSGFGIRHDVGEFQVRSSDTSLADARVLFPPFHGGCRSTVTPI